MRWIFKMSGKYLIIRTFCLVFENLLFRSLVTHCAQGNFYTTGQKAQGVYLKTTIGSVVLRKGQIFSQMHPSITNCPKFRQDSV